jgi:hypothetical protein
MNLGYCAQRTKQVDGFLSSCFGAGELVHNITRYETKRSVKHVRETGSGRCAYSEQWPFRRDMGVRVSLLHFRAGRRSLRRHRTAVPVSLILHSLSLLPRRLLRYCPRGLR